ncbi:hypothetical protein [uncultured Aquimarina sp.]|uniref:hypothetical protein n=1 Tax=uncultured Aquimarina sp. TaxID=575652 RepID=UPI00261F09E8|nr:hypothetical protein [uncultured Aquimarina sp.]
MLQNILKLEGIEVLTKSKQKVITGGTIRCTCGFSGGGMPTYIEGATIGEALQMMGGICNGQGAQCNEAPSMAGAS